VDVDHARKGVEQCESFSDAAYLAVKLATEHSIPTFVQRLDSGWLVSIEPGDSYALDFSPVLRSRRETDSDYAEREWDRYVRSEVLQPLREEFAETQDSYARSNES
jgi:hypothetical protein